MIIIRNVAILEKYTMYLITLGNCSCIALLPAIHGSICSFWKNIIGHFVRFPCNHSLCTGSTVVGQCMEQLPNGYALITGFLRYKLLPVIYHPGWLSPFNFVPYKISHPKGSLRSCKIVPTILSANHTN